MYQLAQVIRAGFYRSLQERLPLKERDESDFVLKLAVLAQNLRGW